MHRNQKPRDILWYTSRLEAQKSIEEKENEGKKEEEQSPQWRRTTLTNGTWGERPCEVGNDEDGSEAEKKLKSKNRGDINVCVFRGRGYTKTTPKSPTHPTHSSIRPLRNIQHRQHIIPPRQRPNIRHRPLFPSPPRNPNPILPTNTSPTQPTPTPRPPLRRPPTSTQSIPQRCRIASCSRSFLHAAYDAYTNDAYTYAEVDVSHGPVRNHALSFRVPTIISKPAVES